MLTFRSRYLRALPWLMLGLGACGDDGKHHGDLDNALCADAAAHCDAGRDGQVVERDGEPDEQPPDMGDDAAASGNQESDASGDGGPQADSDAQSADDGSIDAHVEDDAGTLAGNDASMNGDAGTSADAGDSGDNFAPVRFSATDHGASALLSPDRMSVENRGEDRGNARSDAAITAGSGVFYFEARRLIEGIGYYGVGIATASAPLTTELDATPGWLGLLTSGDFADGTASCSAPAGFPNATTQRDYGFVVDYRGSSPRLLYVLEDQDGNLTIMHKCTSTLSGPVYVFYAGVRYEVGYQIAINTGSDTVNQPFARTLAQVQAALTTAGEASAASALVFGYGKTRARPASAAPTLTAPADRTVAPGSQVTLSGSASDAEDGDLTAAIVWTDTSSPHHAQVQGTGGSFGFTAALGRHPVTMSVTDSVGRTTQRTIMVDASGTPAQVATVRLVPRPEDPLAGEGVVLSDNDLAAHFGGTGAKRGVRANQAIYGQFWYFEAHRLIDPGNMGMGLMVGDGSLNPYDFVNVPWSCSVNMGGLPSSGSSGTPATVWYNLDSLPYQFSALAEYYGFAVDYRCQHPVVHILAGGVGFPAGGSYVGAVPMKDVWLPLFPIVYGNQQSGPGPDVSVNFGADTQARPFALNPSGVLSGAGVSTSGFVVGWGHGSSLSPPALCPP